METVRECKDIGHCRSKAARTWIRRKGCYASKPCCFLMSSASCTFETSHVRDRGIVDIQNWNGYNTNEASLPRSKAEKGWWKPPFGGIIPGFHISHISKSIWLNWLKSTLQSVFFICFKFLYMWVYELFKTKYGVLLQWIQQ